MTNDQVPMTKQAPITECSNHRTTRHSVIGHWNLFGHWFLVIGAFCLAGCGGPEHPDVGRVSGVVTLDGQPLAEATVMFQPENGRASIATTDSAGKYSLLYLDGVPGAILGAHTVIIRTEIPGEDGQPPIAKEKLPKRYHDNTELTADVKPGSNTFDFPLTSQAGGGKK
jgi:hypothetical protein